MFSEIRKTPKIIIYILVLPLFASGVNKITLPNRIRYLHSFISISVAIIILFVIVREHYQHALLNLIWNLSYSLEYVCTVVYNVLYGQEFLRQLETRLQKTDAVKVRRENLVILLTVLMVANLVANKAIQAYMMFLPENTEVSRLPVYVLSQIAVTCCDLECVWRFYLILLVHNRVSCTYARLKELYPKDWCDADDEVDHKEVEKLFENYKNLVELAREVTENIQVPFILRLTTELVGIFIGLYVFVTFIGSSDAAMTVSFITNVVNLNVMNLLPCAAAELVSSRCRDLHRVLLQQTLRTNIRSRERRALLEFGEHVRLRRVSFRLFRSYRLGAGFVLHVTRVTTTYSIFMLQSAKFKFF